jgi:2-polyprenyl-6-methoxyphenol hydroxylase-like FAD-dependent oxidoreductase
MLAFLLARAGVDVIVLEKHDDFFRDFRGDTVHPSTLEILEELGIYEDFHKLPHHEVSQLKATTDRGTATIADLRHLNVRHPYVAFVPQWDFLDFVTDQARKYPGFKLLMGAEVYEVVRDREGVRGVRYRTSGTDNAIRAKLVVAADGRHSTVRRSVGLAPRWYGAPMDVLWFRLSRRATDPEETFGRLSRGRILALINRETYWQMGYVIPKGSADDLRGRGIDTLRATIAELAPFFTDRVQEIRDWNDVKLLDVQINRLKRWWKRGLLCIGDAAHAMSPVGGVGINLAIQDAVATANYLAEPLLRDAVTDRHLARVQRRRYVPTVVTQAFQRFLQHQVLRPLLQGQDDGASLGALGALAHMPAINRLPARMFAVGVRPEHVRLNFSPRRR